MKARVEVSFRPGVLDPEAQAIERALGGMGFAGVHGVRRAKVIELELAARRPRLGRGPAQGDVRAPARQPVIETYRISLAD